MSYRFELRVPAFFSWKDSRGEHQSWGYSRNISAYGVYVVCTSEGCPAVGSLVLLELAMPSPDPGVATVQLKGEGRVVRHEALSDGAQTFAAEGEFTINAAELDGIMHR